MGKQNTVASNAMEIEELRKKVVTKDDLEEMLGELMAQLPNMMASQSAAEEKAEKAEKAPKKDKKDKKGGISDLARKVMLAETPEDLLEVLELEEVLELDPEDLNALEEAHEASAGAYARAKRVAAGRRTRFARTTKGEIALIEPTTWEKVRQAGSTGLEVTRDLGGVAAGGWLAYQGVKTLWNLVAGGAGDDIVTID